MSIVLGSYEHYEEWSENKKNKASYLKATSYLKLGKVFLKCNNCPWESAISHKDKGWNIGTLNRHLRESEKCNSIISIEDATPMDSSDSEVVSLTLDIIPKIKYSKTHL